jgi:hypothetical protein
MIELTPEQRQAVAQGGPVRLVDETTHDAYVLVRAEVYERLSGAMPPATHESPAGIEPLMLRSMQAFWRDLPELLKLKSKKKQWVAYQGDGQIGFGKTQTELYQECLRRGLQRGQFYVGKIQADPDGVPPWGTFLGERSLYEFTEREEGDVPFDAR